MRANASPMSPEPQRAAAFQPPPDRWAGMVRRDPPDKTAADTRKALGLPADRPVVMSGHQPGFWHPGILAKWFALRALAERIGAAPAWVLVDQSPGARIEYPARAAPGRPVRRASWVLARDDTPTAASPALTDVPQPPIPGATPSIQTGLNTIAETLRNRAPDLAHQLHRAAVEALELLLAGASRPAGASVDVVTLPASGLHASPAFARLLGAMRRDPEACAHRYNEAARSLPGAGVRPLALGSGAVELPLWERADGPGPWRPVTSDRLADLPDERIVLRGLPMTALLRRWACDLFIHGTGGGGDEGYDRVTEAWLGAWMPHEFPERALAPAVVATATLPPIALGDGEPTPTPREIAAARVHAHRASHDPALLGDAPAGRAKRELAERIERLPRGSRERAELFRQMHRLRAEALEAHADRVRAIDDRAEALAARRLEAELASDRTWPFPLHGAEAIGSLRREVSEAFAGVGAPA